MGLVDVYNAVFESCEDAIILAHEGYWQQYGTDYVVEGVELAVVDVWSKK
jgi:hypothetical protein